MALALQALAFVAGDDDALGRFIAGSGLSQGDLAARADDPVLLGFVLDFLLSEDRLAERFCTIAEVKPETVMRARAELPGGDAA